MNAAKKRRETRTKERRKYLNERRNYLFRFPSFEFENEKNAPPGFVEAIKAAAKKIDFYKLTSQEQNLLTHFKIDPIGLTKQLKDHDINKNGIGTAFASELAIKIGQNLFDTIGTAKLAQWIPYCFPQVKELGKTIKIRFSVLKSEKGEFGRVYYSEKRPTVTFNGNEYIVGWSRHAIDQICSRIAPQWLTYCGAGAAFLFLCEGYQRVSKLTNGAPTLVFYDKCVPRAWSSVYVNEILDEQIMDPNFTYYYKLGYCPIVTEGRFVKAMTLLCPGYRQTPEWKVINKLTQADRDKWFHKAESLTTEKLYNDRDFSVLKFYHTNGVQQVIKKQSLIKQRKSTFSLSSMLLTDTVRRKRRKRMKLVIELDDKPGSPKVCKTSIEK